MYSLFVSRLSFALAAVGAAGGVDYKVKQPRVLAPTEVAQRGPATAPPCELPLPLYEIGGATGTPIVLPAELAQTVALTFDDGPDELGMTDRVLDALKAYSVPATFFINTDTHTPLRTSLLAQATVRRILVDGHRLGNHTATHPELAKMPSHAVADELDAVENGVRLVTGDSDAKLTLMRAPYGRPFNPGFRDGEGAASFCGVAQAVAPRAVHVYWDLDPRDWEVRTAAEVLARVERLVMPNDGSAGGRGILLMHSDRPQTAAALPAILAMFRAQGIRVVDLETYVALVYGAPSAQLMAR